MLPFFATCSWKKVFIFVPSADIADNAYIYIYVHTYIHIYVVCDKYSIGFIFAFATLFTGMWVCEFSLNVCVFVYFSAFGRCHCCCYCSRRCACAVDRGCRYCCRRCSCSCCYCCNFIVFIPLLDIGQRYFDLYLLRFIIIAIADVCATPVLDIDAIQIVPSARSDCEQTLADIRRQWEWRQLLHAAAGSAYWRRVSHLHGLLGWQQLHWRGSLRRCARHRQQRVIPAVL